jgi:hypothetical protein
MKYVYERISIFYPLLEVYLKYKVEKIWDWYNKVDT